ncbi:hypothetical protein N9242_05825 [Vicingaceae bacterium]|nr:hypothetical protein [Vicingaceae bacterium]
MSKKYKANITKKTEDSSSSKTKVAKAPFSLNDLNNKTLWVFTALLVVVYFIASTFSDGFYMHDEPMFYMYAKDLLKNPAEGLLGFQKVGYTLFLVLPSLLGFTFVKFICSLISAVTVMYSYKIIKKLGGKNSFLIFFLLGLQPLWFMLAFRDFSEYLVAFLLVMTIWNHLNGKYIFGALLLSYAALTRIEYHVLLGLYFIILVAKKQWIPALCTGALTLLHNIVGFVITDDPLYLMNKLIDYSSQNNDAYPKRGFDYYIVMSNIVYGSVSIMLFFNYIGISILKKKKPMWIMLVPVVFIFFLYCIFNHQTWEIGVGGGNLRYVLPIAPFMCILGVLSLDDIMDFKKRYLLLIFLVPVAFLIGVYQTFDHNFMSMMDGMVNGEFFEDRVVKFWIPLILAITTIALIIFPLKRKHYMIAIPLLTIILAISSVRTFSLNSEDITMKKAGKWYNNYLKKNKTNPNALFTEDSQIACSHILFYHFTDKTTNDFKKKPIIDFTKEDTDSMSVGDLIVWESHYGYRPKLRPTSQPYDFYDKSPNFEKIQYYQSKDKRFLIAFFRKIKD